ncbi:hydroxyisourate hydrolase [Paenibacillus turpanensis]|uniref:hydroxyisourate hydrolase n=1 Tax=Paenibacillus turpanensis TaxID=2689078 RepID=UPI0014083153|nr:hydroxyisourate hydrolase [Paenibacillus turpanensis]
MLTTHVLDLGAGHPGKGIKVQLWRCWGSGSEAAAVDPIDAAGGERLLAEAVTNADGRLDRSLLSDGEALAGCYELRFAVGDYYRELGVYPPEGGFLEVVPVRFRIEDDGRHMHVPLLVSPGGYSTYRGS